MVQSEPARFIAMEPPPIPRRSAAADPLTTRAAVERISEPTSLNGIFAILATLVIAGLFGSWVGNGKFENIALVILWLATSVIVIFIRDYWWTPPLVLSTLAVGTTALGFPLGGMEIGVLILAITFPIKLAMKTLRKAEPEMTPNIYYWAVTGFVVAHCVIILIYSKIQGVPLKNIEKSYFQVVTPLVLFGLLIRYCHVRTVRPTVLALFFTSIFTIAVSIVVRLKGMSIDAFDDLGISFSWLDADNCSSILRGGPFLFIGGLAFWPTIRSGTGRALLGFAIGLAFIGTVAGGGRLPLLCCIIAGIFFAVIRGKLWLALPFAIFTALLSLIITAEPDVYFSLPEMVQRSMAPLNFSQEGAQLNEDLSGSDEWHKTLRDRSFPYWFADTNSFWLGHGFKAWDQSISKDSDMTAVEMDHMVELAVEMGDTENMFSSITNIFGMTGLVLYACFLINLTSTLLRGYRLSPPGSDARALCEFSLVNILTALIFCCYMGYIPSLNLIYWVLGVLAARPYLAGKLAPAAIEVVPVPEIPAFARPAFAQQTALPPHRNRPART